jgi:RimJ/RimL family protein N-acetyltransferase
VRIVLHEAGVTLRPFAPDDFDVVWREETRDRGAFEAPWSADDATAKAQVRARVDHSGSWRDGRVLDLAVVVDDEIVGDIQARRDPAYAPPGIYDLGIGLFAARRGRGVGTIAIRSMTTFLFEEERASRVTLSTDIANAAMRRVAEKAGFIQEGVMRGFWSVGDGPARDYALYARTRADHEAD